MLDYKTIVRLKKLGLKTAAIANNLGCKWESVERIVSRCESVWGSVEGVPENLTNEEIADYLFIMVPENWIIIFGLVTMYLAGEKALVPGKRNEHKPKDA